MRLIYFLMISTLGASLTSRDVFADPSPHVVASGHVLQACTRNHSNFPHAHEREISCLCPVDAHEGSVWGDLTYTSDSSLCAAAVHAGVIPHGAGGVISVRPTAGCSRYDGTLKNRVKSSSWGSFQRSFYFPGYGDGACSVSSDVCPPNFSQLKDSDRELSCVCRPQDISGTIYGDRIYTTDSSICTAAVHAGAISPKGGKVSVRSAPGCAQYRGTQEYGITSRGWGRYQSSFYFVGFGEGRCEAVDPHRCPRRFVDAQLTPERPEISCSCGVEQLRGSVYGTGLYTADSSLCTAAVHAGLIGQEGGQVQARATSGCSSYKSTTANGITSSRWGRYNASFYFPKLSDGRCSAP